MLDIDKSIQQSEPDCSLSLATRDLILRAPSNSDLNDILSLSGNPAMTKNLLDTPYPANMTTAANWLSAKQSQPGRSFVLTNPNNQFLGIMCCVAADEKHAATHTILVKQDYWNRGIATQATQMMLDWSFTNFATGETRLDVIYAKTRASCARSRHVVEKCGFQYCGTGMARSSHYRGMVPIDKFRLDRRIWTALKSWSQLEIEKGAA